MTRQRRRLLIPIIHLITRIYHAYRLCTNQVCPPFAFRINQGRLVLVSPSLVRDLPSFATPSTDQKFYIIKLLSLSVGSFRVHAVYHVLSELSFLSYLYQYLLRYPGFFSYYSLRCPDPFFRSS
jgi:hypothetical protein